MDQAQVSLSALASVEADLHPSQEPDATRIAGQCGMEIRDKRTRPLVEFRSLAHEQCFSEIFLQQPGSGIFIRLTQELSTRFVNRRIRNRTYGGVGGRRG